MHNRLTHILIRIIVSLIIIFSMPILVPKLKTVNKTEVDPIITLIDLGCKDSDTNTSLVGQAKFHDNIGKAYHLELYGSAYVDIMMYEWESKEIAKEHYKDEIALARQEYFSRTTGSAFSNNVVPKIPYDKAIEYMFPVDLEEWNVDAGYSTTDIHTDITSEMSSVFIVLLKDNQVMSIEYNNDLLLDSDNIKIFNDLFEKCETLFQ